jgi:hypothetical protein
MRTPVGFTNERFKKPLWESYVVWAFVILEAGAVTTLELVAGFDRVLNALGLEGLIAPRE